MPDDEPAAATPRSDHPDADAAADEPAPPEPPIEPGSPALENVLFVLLGVAVALGVVLRLVQLFG